MTSFPCNKCPDQFNTSWDLEVHENLKHKKTTYISVGTDCLFNEEDEKGPDRLIEIKNSQVNDHKVLLFEWEISEIYNKMVTKNNNIAKEIMNNFHAWKTINKKFTMTDGARVTAFRTDDKELIKKLKNEDTFFENKTFSKYFEDIEISTPISFIFFQDIMNILNFIQPDSIIIGMSKNYNKKAHRLGRLLNVTCKRGGNTYQFVLAPLIDTKPEENKPGE